MKLLWIRSKDADGTTVYTAYTPAPDAREVMLITSYGGGDFGVAPITDGEPKHGNRYWAEGLVEAKAAAAVMFAGGDPRALHNTRTSHERRSIPPRGSWKSIWQWRCSCGEKSSGGKDADRAKVECREHRIAGFEAWLKEQAS